MTRDELRGIVEDISDEQLKKILDINSADVGKVKKNSEELKKELDAVSKTVEELKNENSDLKVSQYEAENMKNKIDELQKVIDDRKAQDDKAAKDAEILQRFEAAIDGAEFLNDFTRNGVLERFSREIENQDNAGRSDVEILDSITSKAGDVFSFANDAPTVLASTSGFGADLSMGEVREIMGLAPLD